MRYTHDITASISISPYAFTLAFANRLFARIDSPLNHRKMGKGMPSTILRPVIRKCGQARALFRIEVYRPASNDKPPPIPSVSNISWANRGKAKPNMERKNWFERSEREDNEPSAQVKDVRWQQRPRWPRR